MYDVVGTVSFWFVFLIFVHRFQVKCRCHCCCQVLTGAIALRVLVVYLHPVETAKNVCRSERCGGGIIDVLTCICSSPVSLSCSYSKLSAGPTALFRWYIHLLAANNTHQSVVVMGLVCCALTASHWWCMLGRRLHVVCTTISFFGAESC